MANGANTARIVRIDEIIAQLRQVLTETTDADQSNRKQLEIELAELESLRLRLTPGARNVARCAHPLQTRAE